MPQNDRNSRNRKRRRAYDQAGMTGAAAEHPAPQQRGCRQ